LSRRNVPALLWAAVACALVFHNAYLWLGKQIAPDTDILALLPVEQRDPMLRQAFTQIVDAASQRLVVLIGADGWSPAVRAADAYEGVLAEQTHLIEPAAKANDAALDGLNVFAAHRLGLLTARQEAELENRSAEYWADAALGRLYSPFAALKLGTWQDDPFGLFAGWLQERAAETPVRPRDGRLSVSDGARDYVVLPLTIKLPAFSLEAQHAVVPLLERARHAARQTAPEAEVLTAGVILHAAAAAEQARREVSIIGIGSTLGIVLLTWAVFRSLKPIVWVMLSIAVGCLAAVSMTCLVFDHIHALTLVFGASLIGVAEDYGIYYLCNRVDEQADGRQLFRRVLPALTLALITSVIGYLALALPPFPGLRQMAFFSATGLVFAWITVACWFPELAQGGALRRGELAARYSATLARWPRLHSGPPALVGVSLFLMLVAVGLFHLQARDDIRLLQNPPKELLAQQMKVGKLLDAPSPVQFYLVRGATVDAVLEREEVLTRRLEPLIAKRVIGGYSALSSWTPSSPVRTARTAAVEEKLLGGDGALSLVAKRIGEDHRWVDATRKRLRAADEPLGIDDLLKSAPGEPLRYLWLGQIDGNYVSVVALRGIEYSSLPRLREAAEGLEGVAWVDRIDEISSVLGRYRRYMGWVAFFSYFAVYALLYPRYSGGAWRVVAPAAVASVTVLALLGALGHPLQLFHVLALMLLLGIGVDYGIFLHEPASRRDSISWLAVGVSAASTVLSFGLLALSRTPALQAFGLTVLIGIAAVWVLAPCFVRNRYDSPQET
jgi:predicted exporter